MNPEQQAAKIAELEARLERAQQAIAQLQQQNRNILQQLNQQNVFSSTIETSSAPILADPAAETLPHQSQSFRVKKRSKFFQNLNLFWRRFQLIGIASVVAASFISIGIFVDKNKNPINGKGQPSSSRGEPEKKQQKMIYNVSNSPQFKQSKLLQKIVDDLVNIAKAKGLNTSSLSITLIDLKTNQVAAYQQQQPRFPASVVKLFWLVYLYGKLENQEITGTQDLTNDVVKVTAISDNDAASRILDLITETRSGIALNEPELTSWIEQRKQVNRFFEAAGYGEINLSQKTFPVPHLQLAEPQGRELQMRGDPQHPIRNKISTEQASRLMYEIFTRQAISEEASEHLIELLAIAPETRIKNRTPQDPNIFNSVHGFFSQSLPNDVTFAGKAGWTSGSRQETAYIATPDGKTAYILTIFAEDKAYAFDWKIFPQISRIVFDRMTSFQKVKED